MKVLVTGGGGYIGSVLTRLLLEKGYNLKVIDRFFFGIELMDDIKDKVEIIKDDIRFVDPNVLKGVDVVMDLAALSNDPSGELDPEKTMEINYKGRVRIAKISKKMKVKRYILASSCSVYGFQEGILNEESKLNPLTTYAQANALAEKEVIPLGDNNFTVTVLRQATVYGFSPRMRFDLAINGMVMGFYKNGKIPILRDGTQWRPFVHIKDTSMAFITVMNAEKDIVNKQIFNVGSNEQNCQIFQLAKLVAETMEQEFRYEWYGSPDNRSYRINFDKIKNLLKFKCNYTIQDGVKEIYNALKDGKIDPNDPKTITVKWYKHLIEMDKFLNSVKINNILL